MLLIFRHNPTEIEIPPTSIGGGLLRTDDHSPHTLSTLPRAKGRDG